MDLQEQYITNHTCRDTGVQGAAAKLDICFDRRGWYRAGLPIFKGDMTEINAQNPSSWISKVATLPPLPIHP
ncbi:hypothetical protein J6590_033898 [Homalodisca vitripennis]|nr:hypothetical protein J6590_033898 [Homalodisca vitripennis]